MSYQETIDYLFNATPVFEHQGASAYKPGLQTTLALDAHFGHPHRRYKTIHVAGTNGKGSVSHTLAAILQSAGYKVGLYTSPHLVDFRERIRVNGQCISEEEVISFVESLKPDATDENQQGIVLKGSSGERLFPSFFELTTALAFRHFALQQVDIAVIEVGLGGRLDCTNIITPILSVITNISYDHTNLLGTTLPQIAAEKAGIIKPHVPVVIGEANDETRPVFEAKAREVGAPITFAEEVVSDSELEALLPHYELKGSYQRHNLRTVLAAVEVLEKQSSFKQVCTPPLLGEDGRGLLSRVSSLTGLMGRWQTVAHNPRVICDTGHNLAAWQYLGPQLRQQPCSHLRIVFGMVDDKDIEAVMQLLPRDATYYWTQADNHRAIPAERVAAIAQRHNLTGTTHPTVPQAFAEALRDSSPDDLIFVGGSSYVVADFLKNWHATERV